MKTIRWNIVTVFVIVAVMAMCGCEKKEKDAATQQVLKITITPTPVITPEPEQINPYAIVSKDNVTMVNLYLLDHPNAAPTPVPGMPSPSGAPSDANNGDALSESAYDFESDDSNDYEDDESDYDYEESYDDYE